MALTADQEGMFTDLETEDNSEPISFEYDLNESDQKVLLGKGIYFKSRVFYFRYFFPQRLRFRLQIVIESSQFLSQIASENQTSTKL